MRPTIRDIAKRLDISHTTVSRVLNHRDDAFISQETRERVLAVAHEIGYRPNLSARALVTGRSNSIALWMETRHLRSFFADVVSHAHHQVTTHGYEMMIKEMSETASPPDHWAVDGILALDGLTVVNTFLDSDSARHYPLVSLGPYYSERTDFVGINLFPGSVQAVEHLLATGCRRVAYLVADYGAHTGDARYDAYTQVMRQAGREPEYIRVATESRPLVRQAMRDYVGAHGCPDGLFCFNDDMAIAAYRTFHELGVRVPDDVSIIGCDGIEDTEYLERSISTIVQPLSAACDLAWQFLERRIADPSLTRQRHLLTAELTLRESTRPSSRERSQ